MSPRKIEWRNLNGFKVMVIKNQKLMSPGVWNNWYYDAEQLRQAYLNTDWNDEKNCYLFFDHDDTQAKSWIGKVENIRMEGNDLVGDLVITNEEAQKAILLGAKFGISPKILGQGDNGTVKNFVFRNFSLVVDPACKTTFLNREGAGDEGVNLIPNSFYKLNEKGELMAAEQEVKNESELKTPELEEQITVDKQTLSKLVEEEVQKVLKKKEEEAEELKKKKYPYPEEEKENQEEQPQEEPKEEPKEEQKQQMSEQPEVIVRGKLQSEESKKESVENELRAISTADIHEMIEHLARVGLLSDDYRKFVKDFAKQHPELKGPALIKAAAKAWKKERGKMSERKLEEEKGEPLNVKGDSLKSVAAEDVDIGMLQYLRTMHMQYGGVGEQIYLLSLEPTTNQFGWRVFELASTVTSTTSVRGSQFSTAPYYLQPIHYLKKAIDAAKERMRFMQIVSQFALPEGHKDIIIPYRKKYLPDSSWETSSSEYAAGTEISWTEINTADGVKVTPTRYNYGIALTNEAIRTSAINEVAYMREELSYKYENSIDSAIRDQILGTVGSSPTLGATEMSDTVNGCMTIYGGDATDADNSLDKGDTLTTELIAKARRLLMSNVGYYWSSNTFTKSSTTKNPWEPTAQEPFVLFIAPEQEEALLNLEKFTNAAEYGSNEVLLNGEIGKYLGIKIISTTKVPAISSGDNIYVSGGTQAFDTAAHICGLVKAGKCAALVWGVKPEIKVFDWPNADQVRLKLTMSYGVAAIHSDAIVRIVVSDE